MVGGLNQAKRLCARGLWLALIAGLTGLTACAEPERPDALSGTPASTPVIYGGADVAPGGWEAVVALVDDGVLCTGTLLTPRVILTAGHCLANLEPGELPEIYFGLVVTQGQTLPVERYGVHPDFCTECDEDVNDFGYVVLAGDHAVAGGFPAPIADQDAWDEAMVEGSSLTLVGYGESDDAPDDPYRGSGIKREVGTTLATLSGTGLEFLAGGDGKSTCTGDSGGPALAPLDNGSVRLAGVLARGECGEASFYGVPYAALCWLRDESGANLVPEGCESCDCLDTEPGCGCRVGASPGSGGAGAALVVLALVALLRRSRGEGAALRWR
jgi:MYXO-CTERM domain-containing protein